MSYLQIQGLLNRVSNESSFRSGHKCFDISKKWENNATGEIGLAIPTPNQLNWCLWPWIRVFENMLIKPTAITLPSPHPDR